MSLQVQDRAMVIAIITVNNNVINVDTTYSLQIKIASQAGHFSLLKQTFL